MASKGRAVREGQKAYWDNKLSEREAELKDKGIQPDEMKKDTIVKKIKAKLRETNARLKAILAHEGKIEEMARQKEEKKAAPPREKGKKAAKEEQVQPKGKKKEKKEKSEKKEKTEKKEQKAQAEKPVSEAKTDEPGSGQELSAAETGEEPPVKKKEKTSKPKAVKNPKNEAAQDTEKPQETAE